MSSTTKTKKKMITVKFSWKVKYSKLILNGISESAHFGTETTKFYFGVEKEDKSYNLYLASSTEEQLFVQLQYSYTSSSSSSSTSPIAYLTKSSGVVSLDKTQKVTFPHFYSFKKDKIIHNEITFEEIQIRNKPAESYPEYHLEKLAQRLVALRSNPILGDITLCTVLDGKQLPAHKIILAAASTVFAAMFSNEKFTENKEKRVEIEDVKGEVVEVLLDYIYSGDISKVDLFAGDLLVAADKYDIQPLFQICTESMITNITTETAAQYLYLADLHKLDELKAETMDFIVKNKRAVENSSGWKQFNST